MSVGAILLAAGSGTRYRSNKLLESLAGEPLFVWSFRALSAHPEISKVVVVTSAEMEQVVRDRLPEATIVLGGQDRQASMVCGLNEITECTFALIHDAARPILQSTLIQSVIEAAREHGAAGPALDITDTIRNEAGIVDRSTLRAMQTPQCGRVVDFQRAIAANVDSQTDDLGMLEAIGIRPKLVTGSPFAMKITTPDDLLKLRGLLGPEERRTGLGYDIHAFSSDPMRPMILGGIEFYDRPGLDGHSDADVLLHAVVDSLLGAVAMGDIGVHYPNTDPEWRNCPSTRFLRETGRRIREAGWEIVNIDATVIAERPKIMARAAEIIAVIAGELGIHQDQVSVKATTNEKLGSIGRAEGISSFAIANLVRRPDF